MVVLMAESGSGAVGGLAARPALRAWLAWHERERRRMGLLTQDAYAQWIGVDGAAWSRWRSGKTPVPPKQGRRLVALLDHEPRGPALWLKLLQEQEQLALRLEPKPLRLDERSPA